ncbi:MAG TPA: hypothetical protein VN697_11085, partial [Tepidiformaceae bacterium]|nr:hypothetical protein [Tepidiformaceae bacterium]
PTMSSLELNAVAMFGKPTTWCASQHYRPGLAREPCQHGHQISHDISVQRRGTQASVNLWPKNSLLFRQCLGDVDARLAKRCIRDEIAITSLLKLLDTYLTRPNDALATCNRNA